MRKSYLFVAVAGTILASCAQTEKLNIDLQDNEQAVIGFASYSQNATRGDATVKTNLEYYHNTFAVYGTKKSNNDGTDIQYVFGGKATAAGTQTGVTCTYQGINPDATLGDWKYTDPRIWDKQATYDFIAYAPVSDANPIRYYYKAGKAEVGDNGNEFKTTSTYTLAGTNLQATATEAEKIKGFTVENGKDLDLMISGSNAQVGDTHDEYVNLVFKHILSKLNVTFAKGEVLQDFDVNIKEVTIKGLNDSGDYIESHYNNTANPKVSGWTSSSVDANYALSYTGNQELNDGTYDNSTNPATFTKGDPFYFIESLVMPQTISDNTVYLTAKYTIKSGENTEDYTYKIDLYDISAALQEFYDGYNYYLNFTIEPDIIKFNATAVEWAPQNAIEQTIR
jgi:hypothetical protein